MIDSNLIIPRVAVKEAKVFSPSEFIQNLINETKWEMILLHGSIEFAIINTNSPFGRKMDLNLLSLLIGGDCDTGFLWDDMNEANPLAVRNWVDDVSVQPFEDVFLDCCQNLRIQLALSFSHGSGIFLKENPMKVNIWL